MWYPVERVGRNLRVGDVGHSVDRGRGGGVGILLGGLIDIVALDISLSRKQDAVAYGARIVHRARRRYG